jgi:hypothetical protein
MAFGLVKSAALAAGLVAAVSVPGLARDLSVHVLNVVLPDGQVEQLAYRGAVPPHVVVVPMGFAASPFAAFDRMSAMMDRQMDAMMRQAALLSGMTPALLTGMPAGGNGATYVASFSSDGACTRSTQITYSPGMARPQEVTNVSGACAAGPMQRAPEMIRGPAGPSHQAAPLTTLARDDENSAEPVLRDGVWREYVDK